MIVVFASAKGGVGKSTLSCNTAYYLSKQGYKTLLFDSDIGSSVDHIMFNAFKHSTIKDYLNHDEFNVPKCFSDIKHKINENLDLISSPNGFVEISKDQTELIKKELIDQNESNNFVIIDTQAGVHAWNMELMKIADKIYIIVNVEDTSIEDNFALIRDLQKEGLNILADIYLITNRVSEIRFAKVIYENMNKYLVNKGYAGIKFAGNIYESNNIRNSIKSREIFIDKYKHTVAFTQLVTIIKTMMQGELDV